MKGKEAIIDKILSDARANADNILGDARAYADAVIAKASNDADKYYEEVMGDFGAIKENILAKNRSVAELDVKKIMLQAKKQIIDNAFDEAKRMLSTLDKATYTKLIVGMLEQYAEDGDEVTIATKDKKVITSALVKEVAKNKKINLTLNPNTLDMEGGIILSGGGMDKNLTLEVELKMLREELETEIAAMIFDKEN